MAETWDRKPQGLKDRHLPRCIGQVIVPTHNVRDVHHGVIDDDGEVVCRIAGRSEYDHIVQYVVVEDDLALDQIIDNRLALLGCLEPKSGVPWRVRYSQTTAVAIVAR